MKTQKTTYVILAAGAVLGAIATATMFQGKIAPTAIAQSHPTRTIGNVSTENMAMLRNLNDSFASLAEYVGPAVVHIRVKSGRRTDVFGRRMPEMGGEGSGVIIRENGWILTNDHVVGGFEDVTVTLKDGREFSGKVTRSSDSDLAVVKVEGKDLPTVQFADSSAVRVGQFAVAVGAPFGLENTVTIGHVSALGRESMASDPVSGEQRAYPDLIQTDAAINRGNSGGPLLDIEGRVIGINTVIFSTTGGNVGIGFAIPANQAKLTADMLIEKGKIVKGYMGVRPVNLKEFRMKELGLRGGAVVEGFGTDGPNPAKDAGLKEGDVVTKIGTYNIKDQTDLRNAMYHFEPGQSVAVEYYRGKEKRSADVKLSAPPKNLIQPVPDKQENEPMKDSPQFDFPDMRDLYSDEGEKKQMEDKVPPVGSKPRLGVEIALISEADRKEYQIPANVKGVIIKVVESGSVADSVGMKVGDILQKIGGKPIESLDDVKTAMSSVKRGDTKQIGYSRFGKGMQMTSELPVTFK